jgi:hypothetical protein
MRIHDFYPAFKQAQEKIIFVTADNIGPSAGESFHFPPSDFFLFKDIQYTVYNFFQRFFGNWFQDIGKGMERKRLLCKIGIVISA